MLDQPLATRACAANNVVCLERAAVGKLRKNRAPIFDVFLDGELLLSTPRPLTDGSRALLARDYDPARLMPVRVQGKAYDSFKPIKIGEAAKWTVGESANVGPSLRRWMPFPRDRVTPKDCDSASDPSSGTRDRLVA